MRPIFESALSKSHGRGAAFSLRVKGVEVVSLWGGMATDEANWVETTPSVIFSCTKGLVSILAAQLVNQGKLDLDYPVAHYWPEFAQNGKADITVRQAMSHHAGLSALRETLHKEDVLEWNRMVHHLETAERLFPADGPHQYHAVTFGWIIGEILHRITGKTLGALFQERIAKPLGVQAWIGVPENQLQNIAHLYPSPDNPKPPAKDDPFWSGIKAFERDAMTLGDAFPLELTGGNEGFNDSEIRMAEIGGAGGIASATALSKIWSAASGAEEVQLLSSAVITQMTSVQSEGCPVIPYDPPYARWGTGFMLTSDSRQFLSDKSFGHDGFGGMVTFGDTDSEVGFAFITNDLQTEREYRADALVTELKRILHK